MKTAYTLNGIEYAYGDDVVLHIEEYAVAEHSVTALVGANGSGKSTLLNLLAFVSVPARGSLVFFGEQVLQNAVQALRRQTAYVQQKPYLFNLSVLQNIELGLKLRRIDKVLWGARVEKVVETLKLQGLLHKRAHELSGGEVQKVAIARALVLEPKVLLLDEPFSHLDKKSRMDIRSLLVDLKNACDRTILFSSHDLLQAQTLADHVCTLDRGRIMPRQLINTFAGSVNHEKGVFDTGKLEIHIPSGIREGTQLAIDSAHLVLSRERLQSSMRNQFQGRVTVLEETAGEIHVIVEAQETWHVTITHAAMHELGIGIGVELWLSFKSTAVQIS